MKRIKYIIPSLFLLSNLAYADTTVDSVGVNIGYANFKATQTNHQGSIVLAKQPDESYVHGEIYTLLGGVFDDNSIKPSLNYMIAKNSDFINNTVMAGLNKYHYFDNINSYYGVLLGYGIKKWEYNPINNAKDSEQSLSSFVGAVQVGMEYPLANNLLLGINTKLYKHDYATKLAPSAGNESDINHKSSYSIALGLRYIFNTESNKAKEIVAKKPVVESKVPAVVAPTIVKVARVVPKIVLLDSDNDGVNDNKDNCANTPSGFNIDENGCEIASALEIKFDSSSYGLSPKDNQSINEVTLFLKSFPKYNVKIKAYADTSGYQKDNLKLSQQRAEAIYNKFIKQGIDKQRLSYQGMGEQNPIASNTTKEGRDENRRADITLEK